jgi:hypothetical protein
MPVASKNLNNGAWLADTQISDRGGEIKPIATALLGTR